MADFDEELLAPGYRPEYTGDSSLGHVAGTEGRLGARLFELYHAGRNKLPAVASIYARMTFMVHNLTDSLESQVDRPRLGREPAHTKLLHLRAEAQNVLRANCLRMLEVGRALVIIADAYAATDQEAAEDFRQLLEENRDDFNSPPIRVLDPPAAEAPPTPVDPPGSHPGEPE